MKNRSLLLITATVRPQVTSRLELVSSKERARAYADSLRWWVSALTGKGMDMLVVENSGYEWEEETVVDLKRSGIGIHFESYTETESLSAGKGVGEALMYDRVAGRLTRDLDHIQHLTKITGRLTLRSAHQIPMVSHYDRPYIVNRMGRDLARMDTRFYALDANTFKAHFTNLAGCVDEDRGIHLEDAACRAVLIAVAQGASRASFKVPPRIRGTSGSTGVKYRGFRTLVSRYTSAADALVSNGLI